MKKFNKKCIYKRKQIIIASLINFIFIGNSIACGNAHQSVSYYSQNIINYFLFLILIIFSIYNIIKLILGIIIYKKYGK